MSQWYILKNSVPAIQNRLRSLLQGLWHILWVYCKICRWHPCLSSPNILCRSLNDSRLHTLFKLLIYQGTCHNQWPQHVLFFLEKQKNYTCNDNCTVQCTAYNAEASVAVSTGATNSRRAPYCYIHQSPTLPPVPVLPPYICSWTSLCTDTTKSTANSAAYAHCKTWPKWRMFCISICTFLFLAVQSQQRSKSFIWGAVMIHFKATTGSHGLWWPQ